MDYIELVFLRTTLKQNFLVVTCNPAFRNLATTLRRNFKILYSDAEVSTAFTPSYLLPIEVLKILRVFC